MSKLFQTWIFEEIEKNYTKKADAIEDLAKLLSVGKDAVYRRYRGDSILAPEELKLLAQKYNISLDKFLCQASDKVSFSYNPFTRTIKSLEDYLNSLVEELGQLSRLPDVHLKYAVPDLPIFYLFFVPELISFKLYTWGRTIWDFEYLQDKKFDFDIIPYPLFEKVEEVAKLYCQIPSTELWSLNLIDFTINQIEYHVTSDKFANDKIALILCDKLAGLLLHMEQMAKEEQKFKIGAKPVEGISNFILYHNEMFYTDHTIIFSSQVQDGVFATFGNPNFLKSTDERVNVFINSWFQKLMSRSQPISTNAEKTRKWFFARLTKKVNALKTRIESQLAFE